MPQFAGTGWWVLLRAVVATLPVKDDPQPTIRRALNFVRADVAMLLAVGHDNAQFIRVRLYGLFLSVHRAEVEHSGSSGVAFERLGHPRHNLRRQHSSQRNSAPVHCRLGALVASGPP